MKGGIQKMKNKKEIKDSHIEISAEEYRRLKEIEKRLQEKRKVELINNWIWILTMFALIKD